MQSSLVVEFVIMWRLVVVALLVTGCAGVGVEPGASATSADAPVPSEDAELGARAILRAAADVGWSGAPLLLPTDTPADLRDAIAQAFTDEIQFVSGADLRAFSTEDEFRFDNGGVFFDVSRPEPTERAGVVAIDVTIQRGLRDFYAKTYLFRWTGSAYEDATQEDTGVTVTTSVS
jgi:hypothetical protein